MKENTSNWIFPIKERFKLTDKFLEEYKNKEVNWGPLGYVTYKRTYARMIEEENRTEEWWETCQRVVEGTYTIQFNHCKNLRLPWNQYKSQKSAQQMYQLMFNFKFLPPGRGLFAMGTDLIYNKGGASLNNCFQYDTEIITSEGIKKIGDCVNTNQNILTENGKWVSAPITNFGKQNLYKIKLKNSYGNQKTIYTTKNHRWFVKDRRKKHRNSGWIEVPTQDLRPHKHTLQLTYGQGIKNINKLCPFSVARGFVFGDGTAIPGNRNSNKLTICGNKDLDLLKYFNNCNITNDVTTGYFHVSPIPNSWKTLINISENKSTLAGWLAGYFAADGTVSETGVSKLVSYNKENILFVRDVCSVLGIRTAAIREESRISNLTKKEATAYSITLAKEHLTDSFFILSSHRDRFIKNKDNKNTTFNWRIIDVSETDIIEDVYCATVEKYGKFTLADNILTGNCAFVSTEGIDYDFSGPFVWLMDMSLFGVGCAFDTKGAGKVKIQKPKDGDFTFVVDDSKEGWCELIDTILNAYVGKTKMPKEIDYSKIRPEGSPIKTFGGIAPGSDPLIRAVSELKQVLDARIDSLITSGDIVDIHNIVGKCVVSGGVRRVAELSLGDINDDEYLDLKDYTKNEEKLNSWRWASNNSILGEVGMDYSKIIDKIILNGEPGIIYLDNIQKYGRIKDGVNYKDALAMGVNPCAEQSLENYELCNLCELFPSLHDSIEEFKNTVKYAYLYAKTVTLIPTHCERTNQILLRNRRIGLSLSGVVDAIEKFGRHKFFNEFCDSVYERVNELDIKYSKWLCIPESIKKSTIKPSGSVSLLPGVSPGIHYPHSKFYIRRMELQKTSPLVEPLRECGYRIENSFYKKESYVVEFPIEAPIFNKSKNDVTVWEQMQLGASMQYYWSDNNISQTVTFKKEEQNDLKDVLEFFEDKIKTISFLPLSDHKYQQAPYEEITEEEYNIRKKEIKQEISKFLHDKNTHEVDERFCTTDSCEIKKV